MSEDIFAKALRNFTMDAAAGDAIRHLTDKGFTPSQIKARLSFPAPMEYIAAVMWERLVNTRRILLFDPSGQNTEDTADYETVEQYDSYGRKSFLRVKKESPGENISPEDYILYDHERRKASDEAFENDFITYLPWPDGPVWVKAGIFDRD